MLRSILLLGGAIAGFASAQNYSTSGPISVVPDSVPIDLRMSWCTGQMNTCPLICGGEAYPNTCNPDTLTFACTCTNGPTPNISAYTTTLPFYICEQWRTDCVAANPNNLDAQTGCHSLVCGSKVAVASSGGSSPSTASSTAMKTMTTAVSQTTGSAMTSATGASASSSSTSSKNAAATAFALNLGSSYGTGLIAAGMLGAFGLAL